jgi:hypothetical protein
MTNAAGDRPSKGYVVEAGRRLNRADEQQALRADTSLHVRTDPELLIDVDR